MSTKREVGVIFSHLLLWWQCHIGLTGNCLLNFWYKCKFSHKIVFIFIFSSLNSYIFPLKKKTIVQFFVLTLILAPTKRNLWLHLCFPDDQMIVPLDFATYRIFYFVIMFRQWDLCPWICLIMLLASVSTSKYSHPRSVTRRIPSTKPP